MRATFEARGADLVLGVFPTQKPKELGPVRFDAEGRVTEVQDKPKESDLANSWGLAIWGARFSDMIAAVPAGANLGLLFHQAAQSGLNVIACWFEEGEFHDVGTPKGLAEALPVLMKGALGHFPQKNAGPFLAPIENGTVCGARIFLLTRGGADFGEFPCAHPRF